MNIEIELASLKAEVTRIKKLIKENAEDSPNWLLEQLINWAETISYNCGPCKNWVPFFEHETREPQPESWD